MEKEAPAIKWGQLASAVDTIVVLMGMGQLDQISKDLVKSGMRKNTKVAVVSSGTTDKQVVIRSTLSNIANLAKKTDMKPPAVIVIGKVAGLTALEWFR